MKLFETDVAYRELIAFEGCVLSVCRVPGMTTNLCVGRCCCDDDGAADAAAAAAAAAAGLIMLLICNELKWPPTTCMHCGLIKREVVNQHK